jgi:hypothetical protein
MTAGVFCSFRVLFALNCAIGRVFAVYHELRSQLACLEAADIYCGLYHASFWHRAVGGRIYSRAVAIQDSQSFI